MATRQVLCLIFSRVQSRPRTWTNALVDSLPKAWTIFRHSLAQLSVRSPHRELVLLGEMR
ncbi:MAG: hypothetical protein M3021_10430 [Actinomycetota bacterium]|nr:hypothetical protein [Actinomycetota bacterium]